MWDWAGADLLSKVTLDTAAISGVAFHPFDNNLVITHGRGHLAFWNRWIFRYLYNIYSISTYHRKKDGFFSRADLAEAGSGQPVTYTCLGFLESGDVVVGDSEGNINSYSVSAEVSLFSMKFSEIHTMFLLKPLLDTLDSCPNLFFLFSMYKDSGSIIS